MQIDADDNIIGYNTQEEQKDNIIYESEKDQEDTHLIAETNNSRKKLRITVPSEATSQPNPENEKTGKIAMAQEEEKACNQEEG
eukprot:4730720-Ditylum_brightwellii.AAC.1